MENKSLLYPCASAARRVISLDGMWRFEFDPESNGMDAGWGVGLPKPISMPVPASFCDFFTDKESREYCGDFWYETDFFVPGEWSGKDVAIRFGSVTHRARVFVNGVEVVNHEGGFLPFDANVTEIVRYNQYNKLTVLANNELNEYMLPAGQTNTLSNGKKVAAPYFDFYNYAGIHRPVKLLALPKERVLDFEVTNRLVDGGAEVDYTVTTNGSHDVTVEVLDGTTKVAEASGKTGTLKITNAKLWNVHAAYLYNFVIRITDGHAVIDEYFDKIGIRTFEVKDGHFLLNGKPVYLRGFGKHEDSDIRGRGLDLATVKRDYELMKWIGANCFRTSHYPYAEELYQMADEEGFLIIDEVPAVGFMQSTMNFLAANQGNGKKVGYFEKETTPKLLENHKAALTDMITRDKNHASVIAWSILNEPQCTSEGTEAYFKPLFDLAHELDPQKRPRTYAIVMMSLPNNSKGQQFADFISLNRYYGWYVMGGMCIVDAETAFRKEMDGWAQVLNGRPMIFTEYGADTMPSEHKLPSVMMSLPNNSKGQQFADFISLNRYYGWYVMGGMCIVDAETAFRKEMDGWAQVLNGRPMIFTEYGADTMPSEHKLPSVMWSQEYQNEYLDMNHNVFDSYDFVQGELVWNFADFQTTEGIMRANGNKKGIFTRQRQPKDAAFHFRARWTSLPVDYKGNTAQF